MPRDPRKQNAAVVLIMVAIVLYGFVCFVVGRRYQQLYWTTAPQTATQIPQSTPEATPDDKEPRKP